MTQWKLTFLRDDTLDVVQFAETPYYPKPFERDMPIVTEDAELVRKLTAPKAERLDVYDQLKHLHFKAEPIAEAARTTEPPTTRTKREG